jgi:hypothetical protein
MPQTWSISRNQTLRACERRYYFQYLAPAKLNSRSALFQEVALLKRVKNIPMWQGELFHSLAAGYWTQIRLGTFQGPELLLAEMQGHAQTTWDYSVGRQYTLNPRKVDQHGGIILFEHIYDEEPALHDYSAIVAEVEQWFHHFMVWTQECRLISQIQEAEQIWIEPPVFGKKAPGFEMDGVKVLIKVDLALLGADGIFRIFDWKTGVPAQQDVSLSSSAQFQMAVYQLWPHVAMRLPFDQIEASLIYPRTVPVTQQVFHLDQNFCEYTLSIVHNSITRTLQFATSHQAAELSLDDLDFAATVATCQSCAFKQLCQRMLET